MKKGILNSLLTFSYLEHKIDFYFEISIIVLRGYFVLKSFTNIRRL